MPEKNRLLRPDIEQKALRHRQMSLHCFLTSFVRVARAEQVEKTGRLEEKEEEESLLGGNRQGCAQGCGDDDLCVVGVIFWLKNDDLCVKGIVF